MTEARKREIREELDSLEDAPPDVLDSGIRDVVRYWIRKLREELEAL